MKYSLEFTLVCRGEGKIVFMGNTDEPGLALEAHDYITSLVPEYSLDGFTIYKNRRIIPFGELVADYESGC